MGCGKPWVAVNHGLRETLGCGKPWVAVNPVLRLRCPWVAVNPGLRYPWVTIKRRLRTVKSFSLRRRAFLQGSGRSEGTCTSSVEGDLRQGYAPWTPATRPPFHTRLPPPPRLEYWTTSLHRKLTLYAVKKEEKPATWFELKVNTSVYVTGLPDDVTVEEVAEVIPI
eukprot:206326-Chlamydomonas_euryale.AAC.12